MNHFLKSILTTVLLIGAISSCHKDEMKAASGQVEFGIPASALSAGRVASLHSILISVEDSNGKSIYQKKQLTLYSFGDQYLSEPVSLTKGDFKLTEFIVLDGDNNAVYATPLKGSPLAYLVSDPLPMNFSVAKDQTTKVIPQVISVDGKTGSDFGYSTFSFDIVNTFQFYVGVLTYSNQTTNFELTSSHITITSSSDSTGTSGGSVLFDNDEAAITNSITLKDGYPAYTIKVTKAGYITYQKTFTASELKAFVSALPMVITLMSQSLSDSSLIAYYPFSGNTLDGTSHHHDGTAHNGAALTTDRKGVANAAYIFDGVDDYISVPHANELNLPGNFSISLWTQVAADQYYGSPYQASINDIMRKWNGNAEGYPFAIAYLNPTNPNPNQFLTARYDGQGCGNYFNLFSPTITLETFHHFVLVKNGNTITQYVDNVIAGQTTDTTDGSSCSVGNTADVTIATRGNFYRFFKGKIDDIRIYNRAISTSEIASLYAE